MPSSLVALLTQSRRPRILVVGDLMLDRYLFGHIERISPEAPIPVIRVENREDRLGGAGSVAAMLAAFESHVSLVAVTGDDPEGHTICRLIERIGLESGSFFSLPHRETTVKERVLGCSQGRSPQQIIRIDREDTRPLDDASVDRLLESVWQQLDSLDLILVSDYGKGVCSDAMLSQLVAIARAARVPVVTDPVCGTDYRRYSGMTAITPNRLEASTAVGFEIHTPDDGLRAAERLLEFGVDSAVVTLDRDGIAWADSSGPSRHFSVRPRQVCDITGAGDMVLSALGYALASGSDFPTAIELANVAGGLEVERLGVEPLSRCELVEELSPEKIAGGGKIVSIDALESHLEQHRRNGKRIVMTNGCFDLLHPGHVTSLEAARRAGDCLVVGVNTDQSVRQLKGSGRPIVDQEGRIQMLAALEVVDYVVLFDETDVTELVHRVRPDVLVKSAEYEIDEVVGRTIVEQNGGHIERVPVVEGYSTSLLIDRVCAENRRESC